MRCAGSEIRLFLADKDAGGGPFNYRRMNARESTEGGNRHAEHLKKDIGSMDL